MISLNKVAPYFRTSAIAVAILVTLSLFIVPLPARVLDILIVINLAVALMLILRALFTQNTINFYSFPQILLLTTFYRLALNVSSTRLILLDGDQGMDAAGQVIESFGAIVVKGDFVVGAIVFAIIAIVNFVVIAKGSSRVAEVSARFMLDSLPGKQLAIDADLRSGNISKELAAKRRNELAKESQFFGSMDGAMKFVQGDAIAGLIITGINAVGGIAIGLSRDLEFSEAVNTFGVLTIGDGLVNIIPALLISVCAGIVVTQGSREETRVAEDVIEQGFVGQLFSEPWALIVSVFSLLLFAILPGFPFLPFILVAGFLIATLIFWSQYQKKSWEITTNLSQLSHSEASLLELPFRESSPSKISLRELPFSELATLSIRVDQNVLAPLLGFSEENPRLVIEYMNSMQEKIYRERGVIMPAIRFTVDEGLSSGNYSISVRDQVVRSGKLYSGHQLAVVDQRTLLAFGIDAIADAWHPLTYRTASWIQSSKSAIQSIEHLGIEVLELYQVVVLEAFGAALDTIEEIIGLDEVKTLLGRLEASNPAIVEEVFHKGIITQSEFAEVLRRLVRERVNIRDLKLITGGIAEFNSLNSEQEDRQQWLIELHAYIRLILKRSIVADASSAGDSLRVFVLSGELEDEFREALPLWDYPRSKPPLDVEIEHLLRRNFKTMCSPMLERGVLPIVLLCSEEVRLVVQEFFNYQLGNSAWLRTLSYQELDGKIKPESIGVLQI